MFCHLHIWMRYRCLSLLSRKCSAKIRLRTMVTASDIIRPVECDKDIGATAFLSDHKKFSGVLRHRCSDFLVHEISTNKEIVRLSNLGLCEKTVLNFFKLTQCLRKNATNVLIEALEGKLIKEEEIDVSTLCDEDIDDLCQILRRIGFNLEVYKKCTDLGNFIVLNTGRNKADTYTNFVLYKKNIASLDCLQIIAQCLKIKIGNLCVAGMKDKRAVTCQRASARNVTVEKLMTLNEKLRDIKIGNIYYDTKSLRIGDIYGNHFTILIRELDVNEQTVKQAIDNLSSKGFINYFGLQRFGKTDLPLHVIGRKLLSQEWQSTVEMIIKPNDHRMADDLVKCRQLWWETRDSAAALKCLVGSSRNSRVGLLLRGLVANNDNFEKALEWIPFHVARLYLHSYCSYLWNVMVSRRISEFGTAPILGDLVVPKDEDTRLKKKHFWSVHVVDQAMLDKGDLDMYNTVLPLPGHDMKLPENIVGSWYSELLEKDGLNLSSFHSENPRYALKPINRLVFAKPENLTWSILNYDNPDGDILDCDYINLSGSKPAKENNGSRRALQLEFSLLSSSYATSALRELMHTSITELS